MYQVKICQFSILNSSVSIAKTVWYALWLYCIGLYASIYTMYNVTNIGNYTYLSIVHSYKKLNSMQSIYAYWKYFFCISFLISFAIVNHYLRKLLLPFLKCSNGNLFDNDIQKWHNSLYAHCSWFMSHLLFVSRHLLIKSVLLPWSICYL